jgi:Glycosyl transferase family 11
VRDGNKIFVRIYGGLGNQMFQYAAGLGVAKRTGLPLVLDTRHHRKPSDFPFGLTHFKTSAAIGTDATLPPDRQTPLQYLLWRQFGRKPRFIREKGLGFNTSIFDLSNCAYLQGYWQSERYFADIEEELLREFEFAVPASAKNREWRSLIEAGPSVSLHVRRGDYVRDPLINAAHGTCSLAYYDNAIKVLRDKLGAGFSIFVFSDDTDWAKENLRFDFPTHVVDTNDTATNYEDLRLMASCDHHIIANSSFSWWGAWLNPSKSKQVIAPKRWFREAAMNNPDILPKSWLAIDS